MGYQESIITTKDPLDFVKLVNRVKSLGEEFYEGSGCFFRGIGTYKRNSKMLHFPNPFLNQWDSFKPLKGTRFIYVAGDRTLQYDVRNFVNIFHPAHKKGEGWSSGGWESGEKIDLGFNPIIFFAEELPRVVFAKLKENDEGKIENNLVVFEKFSFQ